MQLFSGLRSSGIVGVLLVLSLLSPSVDAKTRDVLDFTHDLDGARRKSARSGKAVAIFFGGAWCPICRQMREETLASPKLSPWAKEFIWVEIDLDRKLSLAREFDIRAVPTLVIEDSKGQEIRRITGRVSPEELIKILETIGKGDSHTEAEEEQKKKGSNESSAILWNPSGYRAGSICFANVGYGPLKLRSQSGFQALRLMMTPRAPSTLGKGGWEGSGSLVWSNLWAVVDDNFDPENGNIGPYLIDAETLEGNLALSYGLSDTFELELGYEIRSHFGGVLDGVIESFHDVLGLGQEGRDRWPRDQFHFIWSPEGTVEASLGPGDSGIYVQNLLVTIQHNITCGDSKWPAVAWWATLRVGLQAKGFETLPIDGIFGLALAKRFGDFNAYLSFSEAFYSESTALGVIELNDTQSSMMAALEWRYHPKTSLTLQFLFSGGVVKNIHPFDETSKEIVIGMKHELKDFSVLEWGIIENLAPFENSPDIGLHLGYTRRF